MSPRNFDVITKGLMVIGAGFVAYNSRNILGKVAVAGAAIGGILAVTLGTVAVMDGLVSSIMETADPTPASRSEVG